MHFIIEFSNGIVQLSSVYNICAIKSMIVLEMKCPQLSKPEATAARNENSIGDRMEKKPWEKPGSVLSPLTEGKRLRCVGLCCKRRQLRAAPAAVAVAMEKWL